MGNAFLILSCTVMKLKPKKTWFCFHCVCVCQEWLYSWLWIFTGQEGRKWSEGGGEGRKQDEDRKEGAGQDRVGLKENPTGTETNGWDRKENMRTALEDLLSVQFLPPATLHIDPHPCSSFTDSFLMRALCWPKDPSASVTFPFPLTVKLIKLELWRSSVSSAGFLLMRNLMVQVGGEKRQFPELSAASHRLHNGVCSMILHNWAKSIQPFDCFYLFIWQTTVF